MATTVEELAVLIEANTKSYENAMRRLQQQTDKAIRGASKSVSTLDKALAGLRGRAAQTFAAFAAGFAVTSTIGRFVDATKESQAAAAQLAAVLRSTGGAAGLTASDLTDLAGELQKVTAYGDEAVISAESLLLTFTNIGKEAFPSALEATLDMATALNTDLKSAAIQVGKALNDPVLGITALRKSGVKFTEDQRKLIEKLVQTGQLGKAQAMILRELQTEFGGSARAARETLGGALDSLKNAFGDLFEVSDKGSRNLTGSIERLTAKLSDPATIAAVQNFGAALFDAFAGAVDFIEKHPIIAKLIASAGAGAAAGSFFAGPAGAAGGAILSGAFTSGYEGARAIFGDAPTNSGAVNRGGKGDFAGTSTGRSFDMNAFYDAFGSTFKTPTVPASINEDAAKAAQAVIDQLKFKAEQLDRTAREQEIYSELERAGVSVTSDYGKQIAALAGSLYDSEEAAKAAAEQQKALIAELDAGREAAREVLSTFLGDLRQGESLWRSFADAAISALDKIGDRLLNSGLDALFGTPGTTSGGLFGSFLSSLGFPSFAGRAGGGKVSPRVPYLVGERGPELVVPDTSGSVRALPNGGNSISVSTVIHADAATDTVKLAALVDARDEALKRDLPEIIAKANANPRRR